MTRWFKLSKFMLGAWLLASLASCGGGGGSSGGGGGGTTATAPTITVQPQDLTVVAGAAANFAVTASGTAPLAYQWRRGGSDIAGATSANYSLAAAALGDNAAAFSVVVSNSVGSVASNAATLTVVAATVAPTIGTPPQNVSVTAGQTATFTVTASGSAPLAYQWQRNGSDIAGATAASHTTPTTSLADNGALYTVRVSNGGGAVLSAAAALTVTAAPPPGAARWVPVWHSSDTTAGSGSYTLSVVDPAAPATLVTVDQVPTLAANLTTFLRLRGGTYDATTGLLSDIGVRHLVYVKGGSLFRVALDRGAAPPVPTRISSETVATGPLIALAAQSLNGNDALISYTISGVGNRYAGIFDNATTAPRAAPVFPGDVGATFLIGAVNDPTSGALAGLLWRGILPSGASRLFRTDVAFGNPVSIATFTSTIDTLWLGSASFNGGQMRRGMFFIADGALRRLDHASGNLRVVLANVGARIGTALFDDTHIHVRVQSPGGAQLVRAADDDTSPGQVIASGSVLGDANTIFNQTLDHLVLITGAVGEAAVSVRKADGVQTTLPALTPTAGAIFSWNVISLQQGTVGPRVYYSIGARLGSVRADGTDRKEHSGFFTTTTALPDQLLPHRLQHGIAYALPAARVLVQSGQALSWLDVASGDLGVTVGNAPAIATFGNELAPYKDWTLGRNGAIGYQKSVATTPGGPSVGRLDAIYLTDQAGSLLRLTQNIP